MLSLLSSIVSPARQLAAAREVLSHLAEFVRVPISVQLWDGSRIALSPDADPRFYVSVQGPGVIGSILRWPTLDNMVRQYATGRVEFHGGDLIEFFDRARVPSSRAKLKQLSKSLLLRNALPFLRAPAEAAVAQHAFTGTGSNRDYIQFHYDLGNEFYQLFLDPQMQYSCGYFTDWGNSLEQAQLDKMELICRKLRLQPGDRMLDIGCGWGGLVCHAAKHYGVQAHGVTLSQAQYDFAQEKIRREGLEDRVRVELRDYTTLDGQYDKIASVGMYEHVGIKNYPSYFGKIYSLLRDRGILLNHGITRRANQRRHRFTRSRPEKRFIAKYIFPGGKLDHIGHTCESLENSRFEVHDVEDWRQYALTTRFWCQRLSARKDEAIALVGPERYRLWVAYLAGVSYAFFDGPIRIYQVVASKLAKKGRAELPPTRADLYREPTGLRRAA